MTTLSTPWETFDRLLATVINGSPVAHPGWAELAMVLGSYRARKSGNRAEARTIADDCGGLLAGTLGRWYDRLDLDRQPVKESRP